jgi:hypothetical protein
MTTHIFIHLSSLNGGEWFCVRTPKEKLPLAIKEVACIVMDTPDPSSISKDRSGDFLNKEPVTLRELVTYASRFVPVRRDPDLLARLDKAAMEEANASA